MAVKEKLKLKVGHHSELSKQNEDLKEKMKNEKINLQYLKDKLVAETNIVLRLMSKKQRSIG